MSKETKSSERAADSCAAHGSGQERYYVQSHTVRGEPRVHYVVDREGRNQNLPDWSRSKRRMEKLAEKLNTPNTQLSEAAP